MTDTKTREPVSVSKPLVEAVADELRSGEPHSGLLSFRCAKRLEVGLRRTALIERVELSSLIRVLLREGAAARGIDLTL